MAATQPIRDKREIKAMADYFLQHNQLRNYALLIMGIYTALRISDILRLEWVNVYNEERDEFYSHIYLCEQKTSKKKSIALNEEVINALRLYLPYRRGAFIFSSRNGSGPITRIQAWRILTGACEELRLKEHISCHSLRKTWGYHAWTSQEVSPVVIMDIYNHSNYEVTRRYLGVAQDDLDEAYLGMKLL